MVVVVVVVVIAVAVDDAAADLCRKEAAAVTRRRVWRMWKGWSENLHYVDRDVAVAIVDVVGGFLSAKIVQ